MKAPIRFNVNGCKDEISDVYAKVYDDARSHGGSATKCVIEFAHSKSGKSLCIQMTRDEATQLANDLRETVGHPESSSPSRTPDACPACKGTGAEFPGHPRTEKCEECGGDGRKRQHPLETATHIDTATVRFCPRCTSKTDRLVDVPEHGFMCGNCAAEAYRRR